ncbi:hypothetical protein FBU30_003382 [Linnemannia zychae]|nr:hypothetical protein FBU30_003382 [Linnemannia zychae]
MTVTATTSPADLRSESTRSLYDKVIARNKEITHLNGIHGLLHWDQEVMMPPKAADARSEQLSVLVGILHNIQTAPEYGDILDELEYRRTLEDFSTLFNPYELANIRMAHRNYKEETLVPVEVAKASAALNSKSVAAWTAARKESDFSKFAPFLEEQIKITRQVIGYKIRGGANEEALRINQKARASLGLSDDQECYKGYYQGMMNLFEVGFKEERLQVLFADLKKHLIPLIAKIKAKNFQHDDSVLKHDFDIKRQTEFSHGLAKKIGFNTDNGRLDVSTHPFSGGAQPWDVRMTTRYTVNDIKEGITGTVHETGHSVYEQGRNKEYLESPVSQALSLGIHESQSLLWERMVGLGMPFWTYALPLLKEKFPEDEALQAITVDQFYLAFNRVEPGFIRIESDEVTYPMHIILRYEIEKALIEGDIEVADVPALWNAKMKEYLGLEVEKDSQGCLQDIHWAFGMIGYFPTYSLGSIYSVQIFTHAKKEIPNLDEHLAKGEFNVLLKWLNKNVHEQGSLRESGDDLIFDLTGSHLDSSLYVKYLTDKYTAIYDL